MANEYVLKSWLGGAVPTTINTDITNGSTSVDCGSLSTFPTTATAPFVAVLGLNTPQEEKVLCTRSGNTLTMQRAYDNTAGVAHLAGTSLHHCVDAYTIEQVNRMVNLVTTRGDLVARGASDWVRVPVGSSGQAVFFNGTDTVFGALPAAGHATRSITAAKIAGAKFRRAAVQSIPTSANTLISWDTEDWDDLAISGAIPGTSLTLGETGHYLITAEVDYATSGGAGIVQTLMLNTLSMPSNVTLDTTNGGFTYVHSYQGWLRLGQVLSFQVFQNSGGAVNATATLSIKKIGD